MYRSLLAILDRTDVWRYPIPANGDLAEMRFRDKLYWMYKSARPIERAERGSGLEAHFETQRAHRWALPAGFEVDREITLSAVGDLMNHEYLEGSGDSLYRDVADLVFGADLAMANLECVVTAAPTSNLSLNLRTAGALTFSHAELDVASGTGTRRYDFLATACNHSLDLGPEGVGSTIAALRARGIALHGVNEDDDDARRATIVERNGVRVGLMSFTFGLNARKPPADRPRIVNRARLNARPSDADLSLLRAQLDHCEEAGVDFAIAQLHWGLEFELYPRPEQLEMAHHLAELGVDVVFGHHPHVIQPVEYYRTRRDPDRVVPIFYSLGNLTNPFSAPIFCKSDVARVRIAKGTTSNGAERTYVRDASATTVVQIADEARRQLRLERAR